MCGFVGYVHAPDDGLDHRHLIEQMAATAT